MYTPYPFRIKIHVNIMAPSMRRKLYKEIHAVTLWGKSKHFKDALQTRQLPITDKQVHNIIQESNLIEFHTNEGSRRVLIRHLATGLCMTLNLDSHDILTGWQNDVKDNHHNLNTNKYFLL